MSLFTVFNFPIIYMNRGLKLQPESIHPILKKKTCNHTIYLVL